MDRLVLLHTTYTAKVELTLRPIQTGTYLYIRTLGIRKGADILYQNRHRTLRLTKAVGSYFCPGIIKTMHAGD